MMISAKDGVTVTTAMGELLEHLEDQIGHELLWRKSI